jgi:hypothetical protein
MTARDVEAIDREIVTRTEKVGAMSASMVELDAHPGLAHVHRYTPTGVTAKRWAEVEESIARLWEYLGSTTSILDSARAVRARRMKVSDTDRAELARLLFGRPLELSRNRIPMAERSITGRAERVEFAGLSDLADQMRTDYHAVVDFLDAVDRMNSAVLERLGPTQDRLAAAGAAAPTELVDLLTVSATDPLSLTPLELDRRLSAVEADVERRAAELAELAALQADWQGAMNVTAVRLDALRAATERALGARTRVEQTIISGTLPVHVDAEADLRAALGRLGEPDPAQLRSLRRRIDEALRAVGEQEELAQGLLDRRSELAGRLTAYEAKAARLGLAEDQDLLASGRIAAGLLSRRPCDLRTVTRAIADFQNLIAEKQEMRT